jgi:uncharacterized protein (DUF58 family)
VTALLSAAEAAALEDLSLAARGIVDGLRAGAHRALRQGVSTEFRQHRAYQPGDDLKHLDWKALARTDRLYTRQFRETTDMAVLLLLDSSASMAFPSEGVTKFAYARLLAAALVQLVSSSGDAVGLLGQVDGAWDWLPPRGGVLQRRALFERLARWTPRGTWDGARTIARAAELLPRRGLLVVLSDFYDDEEGVRGALRLARRHGHDVIAWQVLSAAERDVPAPQGGELVDAETGEVRRVEPALARAAYTQAFTAFTARWAREAQRDGIEHALAWTDLPPGRWLRERLLQREQRTHAADARAVDD